VLDNQIKFEGNCENSSMNRGIPKTLFVLLLIIVSSTALSEKEPSENNGNTDQPTEQQSVAEGMTRARLIETLRQISDTTEELSNGVITLTVNDAQLLVMIAEQANRMRVVSPVIQAAELTQEQMAAVMVSNYHLALDARYAVGEGILYSAYIHPLKELTTEQVESAIRQVATLRNTFGTSYTSGELSFGVQQESERIDI